MRRLRYGDLPIWAKLLVPFVILIFVWGFFGTLVLVRSRDGEARSRATAQLSSAIDTARATFADEQAALVESVRLATQLPGVRDAAARRDLRALEASLVPFATGGRHGVVRVTDPVGTILLSVDVTGDRPVIRHTGSMTDGAVLAAASGVSDGYGDKHLGVRDREMFVAGPVLGARGVVTAVVVVSTDAARVAHELARSTGAAVTLFGPDGASLAASGRRLPYHRPGAGAQVSIGGGHPFEAFFAPLHHRGRAFGVVAVGYSSDYILAGVRGTAALWAILIGFGVAAAIGIGIVATRAVTVPVGRLVQATEDLERGDLSSRAQIGHSDEIGRLAESFNRMAAQLEAGHAELERLVEDRTSELRRVNDELARASAAKSSFLAAMSHELRTPLNAVIGFADILSDPELSRVPRKDAREMASNIVLSGRHLLTVINDVLDLAKVEAGRIEVHPRPCDLAALLREVRGVVAPLADTRRITLTVATPPGMPRVMADPARTRQILFNLIANAIKFTHEAGHVGVTVGWSDDEVVISVDDDGPGLSRDEASVIFEPFERAGRMSGEGSGLGLALVRTFVEEQRGHVWVESEPGEGATFRFTIPIAPAGSATAAGGRTKVKETVA